MAEIGEYAVVVNKDWKTAKFFHTVGFIDGFKNGREYYDKLCMGGKYKTVEMYEYIPPAPIGGRQTSWYWSIEYTTDKSSDHYRNVAKKTGSGCDSMGKMYKVDTLDGNVKYLNSLDHARAYAYHRFRETDRACSILIYSPSGKMSGVVKRERGEIRWVKSTAKNGSYSTRLYGDGRV